MERKPYPTDWTDAQWEKLAPLFAPPEYGRPREIPYREILNALFYVTKADGGGRLLPHNFPKWQSVYCYFRIWTLTGLLQEVHDRLREDVRVQEGREPTPSAALLGQSVKTTERGGARF